MTNKIVIEVRPHEGGDDSKMLVQELYRAYMGFANRNGLHVDIRDIQPKSLGWGYL